MAKARLWHSWGLLAISALSGGCVSLAPVVREPLRIGNLNDVSAGELGFVPGRTSFAEAKLAFERRHMTGIAVAEYARPRGPSIEVVAADYQSGLHVFQRGVYDHSLSLPTRGLPPYGLALQVAQAGDRKSVV